MPAIPENNLGRLADVVRQGIGSVSETGVRPLLEGLFGERFRERHFEPSLIRGACAPASDGGQGPGALARQILPGGPDPSCPVPHVSWAQFW